MTWVPGNPKIPLKHSPSDDCRVNIGRVMRDGQVVVVGTAIYPHKGEWVEVLPVGSLGELLALARFAGLAGEKMTPENLGQMEEALEGLCRDLSTRLIRWNWTDMMGEPLPQPYKNPAVIKSLAAEEIFWLRQAMEGETPGVRKNASGPSPSTSSAAARKRQKQS